MLNKLQLIGHVGQDADCHTFPDGNIALHFSLATTQPAVTTSRGQVIPEHTTWHRINVYGALAKTVAASIVKGAKLYCEGALLGREYVDKTSGEVRQVLEMDCRYIEYLSPRPAAAPAPTPADGGAVVDDAPPIGVVPRG